MDIEAIVNEEVAKEFHKAYERLAPLFDYTTRPDSAVDWADVPEQNKSLMIAVVADLVKNHHICL